jgi:hypothetical protein
VGVKAQLAPTPNISSAVMRPSCSANAGLREAPMPMLCGKITASSTLLFPCTESRPYSNPACGSKPLATSRYEEIMAAQSGIRLLIAPVVALVGSELPPLKTEPRNAEVASLTVRPLLSTVVIWP